MRVPVLSGADSAGTPYVPELLMGLSFLLVILVVIIVVVKAVRSRRRDR